MWIICSFMTHDKIVLRVMSFLAADIFSLSLLFCPSAFQFIHSFRTLWRNLEHFWMELTQLQSVNIHKKWGKRVTNVAEWKKTPKTIDDHMLRTACHLWSTCSRWIYYNGRAHRRPNLINYNLSDIVCVWHKQTKEKKNKTKSISFRKSHRSTHFSI